MLKFDEATDAAMLARLQSLSAGTGAAADAAGPAARAGAAASCSTPSGRGSGLPVPTVPPATPVSPRTPPGGDMLEVNSGGLQRNQGEGVQGVSCVAMALSRKLHGLVRSAQLLGQPLLGWYASQTLRCPLCQRRPRCASPVKQAAVSSSASSRQSRREPLPRPAPCKARCAAPLRRRRRALWAKRSGLGCMSCWIWALPQLPWPPVTPAPSCQGQRSRHQCPIAGGPGMRATTAMPAGPASPPTMAVSRSPSRCFGHAAGKAAAAAEITCRRQSQRTAGGPPSRCFVTACCTSCRQRQQPSSTSSGRGRALNAAVQASRPTALRGPAARVAQAGLPWLASNSTAASASPARCLSLQQARLRAADPARLSPPPRMAAARLCRAPPAQRAASSSSLSAPVCCARASSLRRS